MKITVKELQSLGMQVKINGEKIVVSPASKITPEIRQRLRESRDEIFESLKDVPNKKRKKSNHNARVVSGARYQQRAAAKKAQEDGVGTKLASLIPDWATTDTSGCGCKSWIKKMNRWGVSGCEANRDAIINHLVKQKKYLTGPLRLVPDAVARVGATKLLDKAMRLSEGD